MAKKISIIGGGIIGAALAYHLQDTSHNVVLYERGLLGEETTAASMAVFTWQSLHPTDLSYQLCQYSWEEYEYLIENDQLDFTRTGALDITTDDSGFKVVKDAAETLRRFGIAAEALESDKLNRFGITASGATGGLYTEREGYIDATEAVSIYTKHASEAGADIRTGTTVSDISIEDGSVNAVKTNSEWVETDLVVNAAGPWAQEINDLVNIEIPLQRTRGPIIDIKESIPNLPFTLFEQGEGPAYYLRRHKNGIYAGRYATSYDQGEPLDPDTNYSTRRRFWTQIRELLDTHVPEISDAQFEEGWVGIRTVSPDGFPIVGETKLDGFFVACGPSGLGITRAPAIADLLATYLETGQEHSNLERLSPTRFTDMDSNRF